MEVLFTDTVGFVKNIPHNLIEAFKSTLESALHCDLALIVCDATGEYDMQMQTTLQTLQEMDFASPYLLVMNKSEGISDLSILPYGSIAISAKENMGISTLKQRILQQFRDDFLSCELFIPYTRMHVYNVNKNYLTERSAHFTDDGKVANVVIPTRFIALFSEFITKREHI